MKPSQVIDLVDRLQADFVENKCPVPIYFGKEYQAENSSPNRVVLWTTQDTFGNANVSSGNYGGRRDDIRSTLTIFQGLEAHLWAQAPQQADAQLQYRADFAVLVALRNQFLLSLQTQAQGIVSVSGGLTVQDGPQLVRAGLVYVVTFSIQIPVVDIEFPNLGITTDAFTWVLESGVSQDTTVTLTDPTEPP